MPMPKDTSKYHSVKTVISGRVFHSKREAMVAQDLLLLVARQIAEVHR